MSKRKAKKAFKKLCNGKPISGNEVKMILKTSNNYNKAILKYFYNIERISKKTPKNKLIGGLIGPMRPGINPVIETPDSILNPGATHQKFIDEFTNQIALIFQVPTYILKGEYKEKNND